MDNIEAQIERLNIELDTCHQIIRDILEALCRKDEISIYSDVYPGEPARNYELANRLGISDVWFNAPSKVQ